MREANPAGAPERGPAPGIPGAFWKKALLLTAAGAALGLLPGRPAGMPARTLSDLCFGVGSLFLLAGLWGLMQRLGALNSLKYGTRSLFNMLRGRRETPRDPMAGGFLEYARSRPGAPDAPLLLAVAGGCLLLSLALALLG